jgi:phospholipid/cholesterol/gamma-HCH transport system ATP-binding protein
MAGDKVAMMYEGKFIKQGTFDEVFSSEDERIQNFYKYNFIN